MNSDAKSSGTFTRKAEGESNLLPSPGSTISFVNDLHSDKSARSEILREVTKGGEQRDVVETAAVKLVIASGE